MPDIIESRNRLNAAVMQTLEGLVDYTEEDVIRRVYSYFQCYIDDRKPTHDIIPGAIVANFDRYMSQIKQKWAKQHGVVPNHPEPKPKKNEGSTSKTSQSA